VKNFDPKQLQLGPGQVLSVAICGDLSPACQTLGEVHFEQLLSNHSCEDHQWSEVSSPHCFCSYRGNSSVWVACRLVSVFDSSYTRL